MTKSKARPPPERVMVSVADVGCRLLCARRALLLWVEDKSLEREEFRAMWRPFKGFLSHIFVLLAVNLTCLCRMDRNTYYTHDALQDFYTNNHFADDGPVEQMITFLDVDTSERLWLFVDFVIEAMGDNDPPGATPENFLVGQIRLRQVRLRPGPCAVARWPELAGRFGSCRGFSGHDATEDSEPFGLGEAGGEAWRYRENPDGNPSHGFLSQYAAHGYWTDLSRDAEQAKLQVGALKNNSWIDEATRAVFLDLVTFNANCDEICVTWFRFEMPPGGGVVPYHDVFCTSFNQYATMFDFWRLANELLCVCCSVAVTVSEVALLIPFRRRPLRALVPSGWRLMRLLNVVALWLTMVYYSWRYEQTSRLLLAMQWQGLAAEHRSDLIYYYEVWGTRWLSTSVFLAWLRVFEHQRVTTQVLVTLQRSRGDLAGYFCLYVTLHCVFALAGYYLFGNQIFSFKTFSESSLSILAFALGEMRSDQVLTTFWFTGPLYFLLLIFIVIFVFHNMFFVILSYNYDSVREERSQLDRGLDFGAFMYNGYLNVRRALGFSMEPVDPLQALERKLIRCGFSVGSLQAFKTFVQPKQQSVPVPEDEVTVKDLNELEKVIACMESDLLQAKTELGGLVSSLVGELHGM